jgi:ABC-type uncharacterized transport system permease subunit
VFQITILFLYIIAGAALAWSRLAPAGRRASTLAGLALLCAAAGVVWHGIVLVNLISPPGGLVLSIGNTASFIGLQLALIAAIGALEPSLRGFAGGLFLLAGLAAVATGYPPDFAGHGPSTWQMQAHILISLFAYGLLTVGAIVAVFSIIQERRLRAGRISAVNRMFAPLETTERLLFGIASAGFVALLLAVVSGFAFVDNLFARHLVHKTALSLLALLLFGILIGGRQYAGWRGHRAVYLYLWGFGVLCLAYFGTRFILENILGRSWS